MTIFKYPFAPSAHKFEIQMPAGAKILTVQMQRRNACIWALVDPSKNKVTRYFRTLDTGGHVASGYTYVGTVQESGLVHHIFEVQE